ncbi:Reticulocyte-binding protein 2 homolog a [Durusdinium trenchii]|uniref:Reticulocyte-binding protein 2 homolog a n=1 Tax=Durusdinium trenchii TaxID=1381693 RepID=A0ABP0INN3_9DINO
MWVAVLVAWVVGLSATNVEANGGGAGPGPLALNPNGLTSREHAWGRCERLVTGGACEDFATSFVWVYDGTTQAEVQTRIADGLANVGTATANENDDDCEEEWKEIMCKTALPPCFLDTSTGVEAPQQMCRDSCESLHKECGKVFKGLRRHNQSGYVPECRNIVGAASSRNSFMAIDFLQQWKDTPLFVDDTTTLELPAPQSTQFDVPCWGSHDDDDDDDDGEAEKYFFWMDPYLDTEGFEDACLAAGGEFALYMAEYSDDEDIPECIFHQRKPCIDNGGEWLAIGYDDLGRQMFECFLASIDDEYYSEYDSNEEIDTWDRPDIEFLGEQGSNGAWLLPLEVVFHCPPGGEMILSYVRQNANDPCTITGCVSEPTADSVRAGEAELIPNGKQLSLVQAGEYLVRLRTIGRGNLPSPELQLTIELRRETVLPPEDSNLIYVRSGVLMPVASRFDSALFRNILVEVINSELDVTVQVQNVRVIEVSDTGVEFEVRVAGEANYVKVVNLVGSPLLRYPLGLALYDFGFLPTAASKSDAVHLVELDDSKFDALRPPTASTVSTALLAGVGAGFVVLCLIGYGIFRLKMRKLQAREDDVDKKEASISKREKELADKIGALEEQEKSLLDERQQLQKEQENLLAEEEAAEEQIKQAELEELRQIDPEVAERIAGEEKAIEDDLRVFAAAKLERLERDFETDDITLKDDFAEQIKVMHQTLDQGLPGIKPPPPLSPRAASGAKGDSDVAQLREMVDGLEGADKEKVDKLIDHLVEKGALRDVAEDPTTQLKADFDASMTRLKSDLYNRKKEQADKLARKRKQRLDNLITFAKQEDDAEAPEEIIQVIEEEINQEFEAEKAKIKQELSQEEFDKAISVLETQKQEKRAQQKAQIERRREQVRQRLKANESQMQAERERAEARQKELASKVSSVFQKLRSVDNKVENIKNEHQSAQSQLQAQLKEQKERQREKLKNKRSKRKAAGTAKVAPDLS